MVRGPVLFTLHPRQSAQTLSGLQSEQHPLPHSSHSSASFSKIHSPQLSHSNSSLVGRFSSTIGDSFSWGPVISFKSIR